MGWQRVALPTKDPRDHLRHSASSPGLPPSQPAGPMTAAVLARHGHQATQLVQVLREVQAGLGWLPPQALAEVAQALHLSLADVQGVAGFYRFFHTRPVGRYRVLFVDAATHCSAPFEVTQVQPARDASFTTHALSPAALLQVYQQLGSGPTPPCSLLAIRAEHFELGQPPGPVALAHLAQALQWGQRWLAQGGTAEPGHA